MSLITRFDLVSLDAQDGALDGSLTPDQVSKLDAEVQAQTMEGRLLDQEGALPYNSYIEIFSTALDYWQQVSGNIESIPVVDVLRLGREMQQIEARFPVDIDDGRLKDSWDLFRELRPYFPPDIPADQFSDLEDKFSEFLYHDYQQPNARTVFWDAVKKLVEWGTKTYGWDRSVSERVVSHTHRIEVFERMPSEAAQKVVDEMAAALALRALFLFPTMKDTCWDGPIRGVRLYYDAIPPVIYEQIFFYQGKNPFHIRYASAKTGGRVDQWGQRMELTLNYLGYRVNERSEFSSSLITHEVAHLLKKIYEDAEVRYSEDETATETMEEIGTFICELEKNEYKKVLGSSHGHPNATTLTMLNCPHEVHSHIGELLAKSSFFAEQVRRRLLAETDWAPKKIEEIYEQLVRYRDVARKVWGYQGFPDWVKK